MAADTYRTVRREGERQWHSDRAEVLKFPPSPGGIHIPAVMSINLGGPGACPPEIFLKFWSLKWHPLHSDSTFRASWGIWIWKCAAPTESAAWGNRLLCPPSLCHWGWGLIAPVPSRVPYSITYIAASLLHTVYMSLLWTHHWNLNVWRGPAPKYGALTPFWLLTCTSLDTCI